MSDRVRKRQSEKRTKEKELLMNSLVSLKTVSEDDFQVQFDVMPLVELDDGVSKRRRVINEGISNIDKQLEIAKEKIDELNAEIKKLTNEADALDYAVAVVSGVITGLIDSFFVGETEIDKEKIEKELAKKYHVSNDNAFTHKNSDGNRISSPLYHRLDDLAHHPTPLGLVASILARYFRLVVYIDGSDGKPHIFFADKVFCCICCINTYNGNSLGAFAVVISCSLKCRNRTLRHSVVVCNGKFYLITIF